MRRVQKESKADHRHQGKTTTCLGVGGVGGGGGNLESASELNLFFNRSSTRPSHITLPHHHSSSQFFPAHLTITHPTPHTHSLLPSTRISSYPLHPPCVGASRTSGAVPSKTSSLFWTPSSLLTSQQVCVDDAVIHLLQKGPLPLSHTHTPTCIFILTCFIYNVKSLFVHF